MKKFFPLFFMATSAHAVAQSATIVKFNEIEKLLNGHNEQIQVINFWATWCGPCVKELPLIEKLNAEKHPDVNITLVSLDYADKVEKVNSFLARRKMTAKVLLLDEIDYNSWIDKVEPTWGGAIPATLVFNPKSGRRKFVEKELHEGDLEKLIAEVR